MRGHNRWLLAAGLAIGTLGMASIANAQAALDSTFSYQGQLKSGLNLVEVNSDFRFTVWDSSAGGVQIAGPVTRSNVLVRDGVFSVSLDFGTTPFNGENRFLQIEVRSPAGVGAFTTLTPRQKMQATPYALQAQSGNAPFVVRAPGSTSNVNMNPDAGNFLVANALGKLQYSLRTNGSLGSGGLFTQTAGPFAGYMGSDARDGQGFIGLYESTNGTLDGTVDIDADDDNDSTNAFADGAIDIRSIGVGGGGGIMRLRNNTNQQTVLARGGADGIGGTINFFDPTTGNSTLLLENNASPTPGGRLLTRNSDGTLQFVLEPDFSAGGGTFMSLQGGALTPGRVVLQSNDNSGSAQVDVIGAGSNFSVNTRASAANTTNAVVMGSNAVDALEIFNEPGVANIRVSNVALTGSIVTMASRSITVPGPGFVIVWAQGDIAVTHALANSDIVTFGVSDSAGTFPADQDIQFHVPAGLVAGTYDSSAAAHGLFAVGSAGTFTYFFNGRASGSPAIMFDINLTLLYVPTAYGATQSNFTGSFAPNTGNTGPVGAPLTGNDIAAERANAVQFNQARMLNEMSEMQVRMDSMRKQLEASLAEQAKGAAKATKAPVQNDTRPAVEPVAINNSEGK